MESLHDETLEMKWHREPNRGTVGGGGGGGGGGGEGRSALGGDLCPQNTRPS